MKLPPASIKGRRFTAQKKEENGLFFELLRKSGGFVIQR